MVSTADVKAGVVTDEFVAPAVVITGVDISSILPVERTEGCSSSRSGAQHSTFYRRGAKCSHFCRSGSLSHCGFNNRC